MYVFSHAQLFAKTKPHRLQPTHFLCPWDFLGKNTGASCHFLLPEAGIELESLASPALAGGFFPTPPPRKTLAILIPGKINFKPKTVMKEKGHYMMKKVSIQQEDIIFVNIYASNIEVVSLVAQMVKNVCIQCRKPRFYPWVRKTAWRKKWKPTPVFLPGKSHGQRSLVSKC